MAVDVIARAMSGKSISKQELEQILSAYSTTEEIVELIDEAVETIGYAVWVDSTANWDAQPTLISKSHSIYVYYDKYSYVRDGQTILIPGLKVGDGNAYLIDKPFVDEDIRFILNQHINDSNIHTTAAEKLKWNQKLDYKEPVGDLIEFTRE